MNWYQKLDQKLLRSNPLLWNLNGVFLGISIAAIHLIFYILGLVSASNKVLSNERLKNYFYESPYILFYVILMLIILIIFAFRYFGHNPLRNLYPLEKGYFAKLFGWFTVALVLFILVPFSFNSGLSHSYKRQFPKKEAATLVENYRKVLPLFELCREDEMIYNNVFKIVNRAFPKPFPLDEVDDATSYGHDNTKVTIAEEYSTEDSLGETTREDSWAFFDDSKPYIVLDGTVYQFGRLEEQWDKDSICLLGSKLTDIQDVSKVYDLKEYTLFNYRFLDNFLSFPLDTTKCYTEFHNKLHNHDSTAFVQDLKAYTASFTALKVRMIFDAEEIASCAIQSLDGFSEDQKDAYTTKFSNSEYYDDARYNADFICNNLDDLYVGIGYSSIDFEILCVIFSLAMFLAIILIVVRSIPLKDLLISVIIMGILSIVYILLNVALLGDSEPISILTGALVFCISILTTGLVMINNKSKYSTITRFLLPTITSAYCLGFVIWVFFYFALERPSECNSYIKLHPYELNLYQFMIIFLIVNVFTFWVLKKWRSLPE